MTRAWAACVVSLAIAATACGAGGVAAADVSGSVVRITGTACVRPTEATGFAVAEDLVLTNAHPIAGIDEFQVTTLDGTVLDGTVVGFDTEKDMALIAVPDANLVPVRFATPRPGERGAVAAVETGEELALYKFEVSRVLRIDSGDIWDEGEVARDGVELETGIEPGSSGAPVVNDSGEVIGMIFARSRERPVAYATAPSELEAFVASVDPGVPADTGVRCR